MEKTSRVRKRPNDSKRHFAKRTVAAQSHALGAAMALVGLGFLLVQSWSMGPSHVLATAVFGVTAFLVFLTSALYHFMSDGLECTTEFELFLERLDQTAIFLFIAGTYTPFVLNVIRDPWKIPLIVAVWTIAAIGIIYTFWRHRLPQWAQSRVMYTSVFLAMGWLLILRIGEVFATLSWVPLFFLLGGALAYSLGAVVYITKKPRLMEGFFGFHELWHFMVLLGFSLHYALIYGFYAHLN